MQIINFMLFDSRSKLHSLGNPFSCQLEFQNFQSNFQINEYLQLNIARKNFNDPNGTKLWNVMTFYFFEK